MVHFDLLKSAHRRRQFVLDGNALRVQVANGQSATTYFLKAKLALFATSDVAFLIPDLTVYFVQAMHPSPINPFLSAGERVGALLTLNLCAEWQALQLEIQDAQSVSEVGVGDFHFSVA